MEGRGEPILGWDTAASRQRPDHPEADVPRYALETIILILVILWLLGAFVVPVGSNLIHILLVIVLVVVVIRLLQGRRVL